MIFSFWVPSPRNQLQGNLPTFDILIEKKQMRQSLKKCKFIFGVRTESWILEKVLKFAQQFSRPGKSLVNGDKEKSIFLLFLGPLLVTYFNNLESGKKTVLLEKSLDFWIQKPVYEPWF